MFIYFLLDQATATQQNETDDSEESEGSQGSGNSTYIVVHILFNVLYSSNSIYDQDLVIDVLKGSLIY